MIQVMDSYSRAYPEFSLCGLNCGLCVRYHTAGPSRCPGCGGNRFSELHPSCPIITCSKKHEHIEYCHECASYPCDRYRDEAEYDSFITYASRLADQTKAKSFGIEAYQHILNQKIELLRHLIEHYDDGRHKGFCCLAVNLFELPVLQQIVEKMKTVELASVKERAAYMAELMNKEAENHHLLLRLRRK